MNQPIPITEQLNPVKTAQEEVAAPGRDLEERCRKAVAEQKTCEVELEKWRAVAAKLADVARMSTQPASQRHELTSALPTPPTSKQRVRHGFWATWLTAACAKPREVANLVAQALLEVEACDRNMVQCAIQRYVVKGLLFQDGTSVVLRSYL